MAGLGNSNQDLVCLPPLDSVNISNLPLNLVRRRKANLAAAYPTTISMARVANVNPIPTPWSLERYRPRNICDRGRRRRGSLHAHWQMYVCLCLLFEFRPRHRVPRARPSAETVPAPCASVASQGVSALVTLSVSASPRAKPLQICPRSRPYGRKHRAQRRAVDWTRSTFKRKPDGLQHGRLGVNQMVSNPHS